MLCLGFLHDSSPASKFVVINYILSTHYSTYNSPLYSVTLSSWVTALNLSEWLWNATDLTKVLAIYTCTYKCWWILARQNTVLQQIVKQNETFTHKINLEVYDILLVGLSSACRWWKQVVSSSSSTIEHSKLAFCYPNTIQNSWLL